MSRQTMTAFLEAMGQRDDATARGVEDVIAQPQDDSVAWPVAKYAQALGFAVTAADVAAERARRHGRPQRAGVPASRPARPEAGADARSGTSPLAFRDLVARYRLRLGLDSR